MGVTKACLKESGKEPVESERLIILVIGVRREWRHFLRRKVGMMSMEQVESEEVRIASETSAGEAGEKVEKDGGGRGGWIR
jgi:hypothetical protein